MVRELWLARIDARRANAGDYAAIDQRVDDVDRGARELDGELVEEGRRRELHTLDRCEAVGERDGLGVVELGKTGQTGFAKQRHVDRERERAETRVRTDVAGRLLAADVLLARGKREHVAAASIGVDGLAGQAAGHLT